jgi:hypothetical protein
VRFKLVILNVLAKCRGGHATLDEVRREVEVIIAREDHTQQLKRFSALGDIDIFQSGLVLRDDAGLQITDAGLSLLGSLENSSGPSLEISSAPASRPFGLIDELIGAEERLRIFDLGLRGFDNDLHESTDHDRHPLEQEEENGFVPIVMPDAPSEVSAVDLPGRIHYGTGDGNHNQPSPEGGIRTISMGLPNPPAFLRRSFGSKVNAPSRKSLQLLNLLFAFIATKKHFMVDFWRRHFAQSVSTPRTERLVRRVGGAAFAFLSLLVVVTCVGAAIALGQIKSLKSDIATLHRELLPLRERLGKLEQVEKTKRDLEQQEEAKNRSGVEKNRPSGEIRIDQTALNLSREEIQLIRDYVKPAPFAGTAAPVINVGDSVSGAMIPLPSQLTEKVPKLLGAKFTTRNGAIIIIKKDSRQADAVLAAN